MSCTYVIFICVFLSPLVAYGQNLSGCESKETCRDCIQQLGCVWCITPINQTAPIHCTNENTVSPNWCPNDQVVSPKSSQRVLQNVSFSSNIQNTVQFKPQRVKLSVRKGETVDVHFQYQQAKNYPVDLYYIMDLSFSMKTHRDRLAKLGKQLAERLLDLTSNVRLGFGSFIDKADLPFVNTASDKSPQAYSFKNHLNLSTDYNKFKNKVSNAEVTGNLDSPEGGLDAIMQAIVCKEQIGWRPQARHLLIFSTDAEFHIAGDGKLAGVIEPNDAKCHMTENTYTEYLKYDYPSVSQINHVAKENNVNIIFAIAETGIGVNISYKQLSERIENSNFGELKNENNNSNIIELIINNYNKIVQSVTLTSNATNDIDVKFSSNCPYPKENGCRNVHEGEFISFTATIKPLECKTEGQNKKIIQIKPEAIEESFIIELDILCDCLCSSPKDKSYQRNSKLCSNNGDLECGICKCAPGRFGRTCQCDNSVVPSEDFANCRMNDQAEICSGQGECRCGKCECNSRPKPHEKIYGKFCHCNNYSCKRENGLLCSGKGTCDCGSCRCYSGYTGDACQCPDTNTTCIAPQNDVLCTGHGKCNCGQCDCDGGHSGTYCEECTTCPAQRCEEFRHCVECQAYQTGLYNENECEMNCTAFKTKIVDKFNDDNDDNIKKCRVPDRDGCIIIFEYTYENKELIVRAQKAKLCAGPPNVLAWILGVIGTILIAGLIMLIIWKVCTTIHDRREYAKFENERKGLKWHRNDNPLYKEATSTFANPVYNRSVSRLPSK